MNDPLLNRAVQDYWDGQAMVHGSADTATAPDSAYRELEINSIIPHIKGPKVLDVGCGNGYSTFRFEKEYPNFQFLGIDYSEKMILAAVAEAVHRHSDVLFITADVRNLTFPPFTSKYDTIISERCLINLKTWDEQKQALLEMKKCLAPDGRILVIENFVDGLNNLNSLRRQLGLHAIEVRWHNRYLDKQEFYDFAQEHFKIDFSINIGNMYYIISRVVYTALAKELGQEPQYSNPINFIAAKLPNLGLHYDYSPNMLIVLRAK